MPKKDKITDAMRLDAVTRYLSGEIGAKDLGGALGVDKKTVYRWIARFQAEGPAGFAQRDSYFRNYSAQQKEAAVKSYLSGEGSLEAICIKYKIRNERTLRDWIEVYNSHKSFDEVVRHRKGGSYMTKTRPVSQKERMQIVEDCIASGCNYNDIATRHDISYHQVYVWVKKYQEHGAAGLDDRRGRRTRQQTPRTEVEQLQVRIAQLERENYILQVERDLLKKAGELKRGNVSHK